MTTDSPTKGRGVTFEDVRLPPWMTGLIGGVALVIVWWIVGLAWVTPTGLRPIPTPLEVVVTIAQTGWDFYAKNFAVTLAEAGIGYLWGNVLALLLAAVVLVVPRLESVAMQLAILTYCVPIVALGQIAVVLIGAPPIGQPSGTAIFLAALSVFFTTVVGALLGLKSADKSSLDVVTVYGGSKFTQLVKMRLIAALPAILNALQIAVPAAFLGAVLGEFFGKVEVGVGVIMVIAQQQLNAPQVWAIALLSGLVAMLGYVLVGFIARAIAPWSKGRS